MKPRVLLLGLLLGAAFARFGVAQIERLTLDEMVSRTDNAVVAEIKSSHVFRVDHPIDGPELYYTTLHLEGRSLKDGTPISVDVTYAGGFINEKEGVHNSEAPSADDTRIGNRIVAFYKWTDNMGGGVAANALYAAHGGLFRTVDGPTGTVVLGRGEGYAIDSNKSLDNLTKSIRSIVEKR